MWISPKRGMPSSIDLWGFCLVGYFAGRFPSLKSIHELVAKWGVQCSVRQDDCGWVIFKFKSEETRSKVLMEGPYSLFGKSLYLKTFSEDFSFNSDEFLKVPIWVKFPYLPMQVWDEEVISEIASRVGTSLTTDRITQEKARSNFARVLIEVDASKAPPLKVKVKMPNGKFHNQKVIYETFPNFCFHCKVYGHHAFTCKVIAEMEEKERIRREKVMEEGESQPTLEEPKEAKKLEEPKEAKPGCRGQT
ncbi:unnamed protein product [Cuscuta epithymum]|uniref:DUF4283 domain-containing protein n=1 Tax=Cuscuta epithymum TaxID=186058 RepID=A0AAV0C186_9ASTE|nr:unnamed protein product [Cuscuta epithymum]CAH9128785.1 unnamed protein product [Cuscuta epithymum]